MPSPSSNRCKSSAALWEGKMFQMHSDNIRHSPPSYLLSHGVRYVTFLFEMALSVWLSFPLSHNDIITLWRQFADGQTLILIRESINGLRQSQEENLESLPLRLSTRSFLVWIFACYSLTMTDGDSVLQLQRRRLMMSKVSNVDVNESMTESRLIIWKRRGSRTTQDESTDISVKFDWED